MEEKSGTSVKRGLDLGTLDEASPEEARAQRESYTTIYGKPHPGMDFWLENDRPGVLKRYRAYAETSVAGDLVTTGFCWAVSYAVWGYDAYIPRQVHMLQGHGFTKSQILEMYAVAFLHAGPRGMETVANGLRGFAWREPEHPMEFPRGWAPDPAAFRSGLDFSVAELLPQERTLLEEWYLRVLGEVPPYVRFLLDLRPDVLKAYRNRFENTLFELPKQVLPAMLLHHDLVRGFAEGVRENVLLAKGFGMTRDQVTQILMSATLYGGAPQLALAHRAAGDILLGWNDAPGR